MKLADYIATNKLSQAAFAEMIGSRQPTIWRYLNGRMPRRDHLIKIKEATRGAVTADDFLEMEAAE